MPPSTEPAIELAITIAHTAVWAQMSTVDAKCRPRSRLVHPVWTLQDGELTGWLTTRKTPLKSRHLAANPNVSLAYFAPNHDLAYFDCTAAWADDLSEKQECWRIFREAPAPVGYDPANIWPDGPTSPTFEVLRFKPYRVQAARASELAAGAKPALLRLPSG